MSSSLTGSKHPLVPLTGTTEASELSTPILPDHTVDPDPRRAEDTLLGMRRFFVHGPAEEGLSAPVDVLPALAWPFAQAQGIRTAYPILLFPPGTEFDGAICTSVLPVLEAFTRSFAPGEDSARALKDNLSRLDLHLRRANLEQIATIDAVGAIREAARAMLPEIAAGPETEKALADDLERMLAAIPKGTLLLAFGEHAACVLAWHAALHHVTPRRAAFRHEAMELCQRLKDLMRVEWEKLPEARTPESLSRGMGDMGSRLLDLSALSELLGPSRGSKPLIDERAARVQEAWKTLDTFLAAPEAPVLTVFHDQLLASALPGSLPGLVIEPTKRPCEEASARFDTQSKAFAAVFRAARIARLETAGAYVPATHRPLLANLGWELFDDAELDLLPPLVALEAPDTLAGQGMASLSRLLLSGRPVQVLARVISSGSPGVSAEADAITGGHRIELGFLGISHRVALVDQGSAARPVMLSSGLQRSLRRHIPSLHVVSSGMCRRAVYPRLGSWMHSGAALDSRAHPFFVYDPGAGESWAQRFDFSGNPQPQMDWPVHQLDLVRPDGSAATLRLAFTFADFGLLEPAFVNHYRTVPEGCPDDVLVPVDCWLDLPIEERGHKLPIVWAVDAGGRLVRLLLSHAMAAACQDRRSYWRNLQELGGVNNTYARLAAERARAEALAEAAVERERLIEAHRAELDAVRLHEAGRTLERLAGALVSGDLTRGLALGPVAPRASIPSSAATPQAPTSSAFSEPEESDDDASDPYITSALCTTCNECTNLNSRMFVYNSNKQAFIKDPRAGTFAQIIAAAEKCPSRCIHPGKPLNPSEPGLDTLIERARRFR